jgi:hypothetical protein
METIELISYKIKVPINSLYKSIFSSMIKILYIKGKKNYNETINEAEF